MKFGVAPPRRLRNHPKPKQQTGVYTKYLTLPVSAFSPCLCILWRRFVPSPEGTRRFLGFRFPALPCRALDCFAPSWGLIAGGFLCFRHETKLRQGGRVGKTLSRQRAGNATLALSLEFQALRALLVRFNPEERSVPTLVAKLK